MYTLPHLTVDSRSIAIQVSAKMRIMKPPVPILAGVELGWLTNREAFWYTSAARRPVSCGRRTFGE